MRRLRAGFEGLTASVCAVASAALGAWAIYTLVELLSDLAHRDLSRFGHNVLSLATLCALAFVCGRTSQEGFRLASDISAGTCGTDSPLSLSAQYVLFGSVLLVIFGAVWL